MKNGRRASVLPLLMAVLAVDSLTTLSWSYSSSDLSGFLGYGGDDHRKLTQAALLDVGSDYPDIALFSSQIQSGASTEGLFTVLGAHKETDNSISYWFGNEQRWRDDVKFVQYRAFNFSDAYTHAGFVIHLRQDITVPAHQKIVGHGLHTTYTVSPTDPTQITVGSNSDQFEKFASNNHVDNIPGDIAFDQPFLDPATGCNEKFWLGPNEDGNVPFDCPVQFKSKHEPRLIS